MSMNELQRIGRILGVKVDVDDKTMCLLIQDKIKEKDKQDVIHGLFNNILEANLSTIQKTLGSDYNVRILNQKSGGNILNIQDTRELPHRNCYIKYENVNPHKSFGYTKEEIEEYLQKIVVGFVMEYDK